MWLHKLKTKINLIIYKRISILKFIEKPSEEGKKKLSFFCYIIIENLIIKISNISILMN